MNKHAYLIMAYNNPDQLLKLIGLLDDYRNDIYVHIDAEADFPMDLLNGAAEKANLVVTERVPVRWADYSQMRAEFVLLETARNSGIKYSYYHLLSGMDLPIKTQDEIHHFFDGRRDEFIGIVPLESQYNLNHVRYRYPLLRTKLYRKYKLIRCVNVAFVIFQKILRIDVQKKRNTEGWSFYDGWTWFPLRMNSRNMFCQKETLSIQFSVIPKHQMRKFYRPWLIIQSSGIVCTIRRI